MKPTNTEAGVRALYMGFAFYASSMLIGITAGGLGAVTSPDGQSEKAFSNTTVMFALIIAPLMAAVASGVTFVEQRRLGNKGRAEATVEEAPSSQITSLTQLSTRCVKAAGTGLAFYALVMLLGMAAGGLRIGAINPKDDNPEKALKAFSDTIYLFATVLAPFISEAVMFITLITTGPAFGTQSGQQDGDKQERTPLLKP